MKPNLIFGLMALIFCFINMSYANDILDDQNLLYKLPNNENILNKKITVERKFSNINQLTDHLNNLDRIKTFIRSKSSEIPETVTACIDNGNVRDLLNQTSIKLGYTWLLNGDKIIFSAISPMSESSKISSNVPLTTLDLNSFKSRESLNLKTSWSLNPSDKTLRNTIAKWSTRAGWQLVWNVNADYPITTSWSINGSFEYAVNQILKASQQTEAPLMARMHDSNKVLEIYSPAKIN